MLKCKNFLFCNILPKLWKREASKEMLAKDLDFVFSHLGATILRYLRYDYLSECPEFAMVPRNAEKWIQEIKQVEEEIVHQVDAYGLTRFSLISSRFKSLPVEESVLNGFVYGARYPCKDRVPLEEVLELDPIARLNYHCENAWAKCCELTLYICWILMCVFSLHALSVGVLGEWWRNSCVYYLVHDAGIGIGATWIASRVYFIFACKYLYWYIPQANKVVRMREKLSRGRVASNDDRTNGVLT